MMQFGKRSRSGLLVPNWMGEYQYARGPGVLPGSRTFSSAASSYLSRAANVLNNAGHTVALWFNVPTLQISTLFSSTFSGADNEYENFGISVAGKIKYSAQKPAGAATDALTTTSYIANRWQHALYVSASATSRVCYLNGGGVSNTSIEDMTINNENRMSVGNSWTLNPSLYADASIAEVAVWRVALSAAEFAQLTTLIEINGVVGYPSAAMVRPDKIQIYLPLFGNGSPEMNQCGGNITQDFTLVNAPTKGATRPPILYLPGMQWASGS